MPEILKVIYDGFEKHGIWYILQIFLLFTIFGGLVLTFLFLKAQFGKAKNAINNEVNVNVHLNEQEQDELTTEHHWKELLNHSFFRSIQKMLNYEIQHLEIREQLRRAIFRDFLFIQFTVIQDKIKEFVDAGDMDKMSSDLFHNKLYSLVTEILQEYEAKALKQGIPEIVIIKFNKWHRDKTEIIYNFVNDVCDANDWYVSNSVKFYSFLNQMVSILDLTLIDARKTLVRLNGELDKVTYKGIVSENSSSHVIFDRDRSDEFKINKKST
jgi:hypothetical protein